MYDMYARIYYAWHVCTNTLCMTCTHDCMEYYVWNMYYARMEYAWYVRMTCMHEYIMHDMYAWHVCMEYIMHDMYVRM